MTESSVLSRRKAEVLRSVVRAYVETGQPVASRSVAGRHGDVGAWSPATIRNDMADLSDDGFLSQPHTSAGRVPTQKAFRAFAQDLVVRRPSASELLRLNVEFSGVESLEEGVERSSRVLTDLTHNVGIAAAVPAASQTLDQIELLPLPGRRVMVVVVTRDRIVRNRIVTLEGELSTDELASIRNYVNLNFAGWVLAEARQELELRLRAENAYYDALLKRLSILSSRGFLDVEFDPAIHMEGASYLIALDLHLAREKMRELLHTLEEKQRILQLLDRFLERPEGGVSVQVGLGDVHSTMKDLSLIGLRVASPGRTAVTIAVLGPMRMRYERVMAAVLGVGRKLQQLPS